MINITNSEYKYLYETHLHTSEASACSRSTARDMVRAHKEAGYTGIFVTNHNWGGNTCVPRSLPWKEWVEQYARGYYEAKEEGDKVGLQVFFGWEAGYNGTEFLIYGLSDKWLIEHPEIKDASVEEQYKLVKADGGMVIHAHPFREEYYIPEIRLYPEWVDGAEIINATHSSHLSNSHNDPLFDERAKKYALDNGLPGTAGSDVHTTLVLGGGMIFKEKLKDDKDFINRVLNSGDYILTNGDVLCNNKGTIIR